MTEITEAEMQKRAEWLVETIEKAREENMVRKEIVLPTSGKLISDFALEIAQEIKDRNELFFRPVSHDILEITKLKDKDKQEEYIGFSGLKPDRFITIAERYFSPIIQIRTKTGEFYTSKQSMKTNLASVLLQSPVLQNELPKIKRIFPTPIPIIYEDKLTFPQKGYDARFQSYTPLDAPDIRTDMNLEEAKTILHTLYGEFCFQSKQDYINAIGGLLTPYLRGLYSSMTTRTPVRLYIANRERAGKDYCANITGIVHEGYALDEPPISNGDGQGNHNEELRKKILASFIAGRKLLHFVNNKGTIDNAVFEGAITSEKYSDRVLGRNEIFSFDNEMEFSLSGNVGIRFSPDLANRSIFIRLFLDIEDANARQFTNPNLHLWVKNNRGEILSALYTLVRNWFEAGSPAGSIPFSSFPEWSRICGGIMETAGIGNPCYREKEILSIGGDEETTDMKALFELGYEMYPEQWIKKEDIKKMVYASEDLFGYLDFNKKSDQTKFGNKITKFSGRWLSGIVLKVKDTTVRSSRQEFMFSKKSEKAILGNIFGNLGNDCNLTPIRTCKSNNKYIGRESLPKLPRLPNSEEIDFSEVKI